MPVLLNHTFCEEFQDGVVRNIPDKVFTFGFINYADFGTILFELFSDAFVDPVCATCDDCNLVLKFFHTTSDADVTLFAFAMLAPVTYGSSLAAVLPIPLLPDVAKIWIDFPFQSYSLQNVLTTFGAA